MRYAIIKDGIVVNVIEWDGEAKFSVPKGHKMIQATKDTAIGGSYVNSKFKLPKRIAVDTSRSDAWAAARKDLIEGKVSPSKRYHNCFLYGGEDDMTDNCWKELLGDYS